MGRGQRAPASRRGGIAQIHLPAPPAPSVLSEGAARDRLAAADSGRAIECGDRH